MPEPHQSLFRQHELQRTEQNETSVSSKSLNLNSINQLIFVMVKCGVLFEVRTEFLNII
jgi:hypothetical protein